MEIVFSPKALKEFQHFEELYDTPKSKLIPTLYLAQREFGYLSQPVIEYVAELLKLSPAKVLEVASFYTMLHKKPVGKYEITICTNVSCALMKGRELLAHTLKKLNAKEKEITANGTFTIRREECLGACDKAPVLRINDRYYYKITPEKMDQILKELEE
ncbi:MAG: NAD(P)H-dependent oxidoreductase subunit E [Deltaproteobacteria bacterium]|nr:NAD(P)H-dependent oxidoreductase subunit E [Deltaproteobacteria bacterium]